MSMSKQDFVALADAIRDHGTTLDPHSMVRITDTPFTKDQIECLATFCGRQNSNFMRQRWLDYIAGKCGCRRGVERDNCPRCEGTGMVIDFKAIREKPRQPAEGAQFTPGPWHVEKCSAPVYGSDGMLMVNGVGIGAGSRHIGTISSKNAHNDANLIAAAPAMYEALQEARDYIRQLVDSKEDEAIDNLTNNGEDVEERLNQILAQAEGRQG